MQPILWRLVFQLKTQKNWIKLASIFPPDLSFQFTYSSMVMNLNYIKFWNSLEEKEVQA